MRVSRNTSSPTPSAMRSPNDSRRRPRRSVAAGAIASAIAGSTRIVLAAINSNHCTLLVLRSDEMQLAETAAQLYLQAFKIVFVDNQHFRRGTIPQVQQLFV